jgi:arsenite oxidase large subunit
MANEKKKGLAYNSEGSVPLPPVDAEVFTTACDYCVVACGYKVYRWPVGKDGGFKATENGFGVNFPRPVLGGYNISSNKHNVVLVSGKKHNVLVIPDPNAKVVNRKGNHSIRGGALAKKCYNPDSPTSDRLLHPMMRVNGQLKQVSWDTAMTVMAEVSKYTIEKHGEASWAMKAFSYNFFENTYAISKIAFQSVQTPAFALHDSPSMGTEAAGLDESGILTFGYSYDDLNKSDVIFFSGTDPYETKTIAFTEWVITGRAKSIFSLPRKTMGVAVGESRGGVWLDLFPGTDTVLHLAMIRYILEQGWEDKEFIEKWTSSQWEMDAGFGRGPRNTPVEWRTTWGKYSATFPKYKEWVLGYDYARLEKASEITGVSVEKIKKVASMLTGAGGQRPKASFVNEKGNYWSNNYLNLTSFTALGLVCGAGNREGRIIGRMGGHQRGWASNAAPYPRIKSPEKVPGRRKLEMDLDRWVEAGKVRFAWCLGTTWIQAMTASADFAKRFSELTKDNPNQITSTDVQSAVESMKKRIDSGGMMLVHQDIYLVNPIGSDFADLILPASGWGEQDFTRANGERRLRIYQKFYDAPGEAKADWWIIAQFGKKMGYDGYDWKDSNEIFDEASRFSRGGPLNYHSLAWYAKQAGIKSYDILKELGTTGIQLPARYRLNPTEGEKYLAYANKYQHKNYPGWVIGTKRLHDTETDFGTPEGPTNHEKWMTVFNTHTGKLIFHKSPWKETFEDFFDAVKPVDSEELWITTGRINETWQSGYDDLLRRPYITQRFPHNFVEMHPDDAAKRGIESGDMVEMYSSRIPIQTGGFIFTEDNENFYTQLKKNGNIKMGSANIKAVAMVTPDVKKGVAFTYFLWPTDPGNSLVPRVPDPVTVQYRFKLGMGKIKKTGESPYKHDFTQMTFLPRTII